MSVFITAVLVALTVSFLCSLMEASLLSLTPSQVAEMSARQPKLGAIWQDFKTHAHRTPDRGHPGAQHRGAH
jgi:hypothetical protein